MNNVPDNTYSPALLSVIIVSFNEFSRLEKCLAALLDQEGADRMEVHVIRKQARPDSMDTEGPVEIHWHQVEKPMTIPEMRRIGIERSSAARIALLEDDCIVGSQWLQAVLAAIDSGCKVIGGPINPGDYNRGLDWAVFYCEYGRFLTPFSGRVSALPGNNVSYSRELVGQAHDGSGFYEIFFHEQLLQSGTELQADERMAVTNINSWRLADCSVSPFHHGRAYAAQRFGEGFKFRRLVFGLLSPLLPVIKTVRTLEEIRSCRRKDLPIMRAFAWMIVFHSCWSAGELIGYLAGPGRSAEKWS